MNKKRWINYEFEYEARRQGLYGELNEKYAKNEITSFIFIQVPNILLKCLKYQI